MRKYGQRYESCFGLQIVPAGLHQMIFILNNSSNRLLSCFRCEAEEASQIGRMKSSVVDQDKSLIRVGRRTVVSMNQRARTLV